MTTDSELSIVYTRKAEGTVWQKTWEGCSWATFFESPEWAGVFADTYGDTYKPFPLEIAFNDGVIAIIPGVYARRLYGKVSVMEWSPGGTYGGPISIDGMNSRHIDLIIDAVTAQFPNFSLRINPFLLEKLNSLNYSEGDFTQKLDLLLPDTQFESLFRKKRVANYAKKAGESGFFIKPASADELGKFHNLYKKASTRWNTIATLYPLSFFRKLTASSMCDFIGCYDAGHNLAGGGLFVRSTHFVNSWLPIIDPGYMKEHVFEFFYYEAIRYYRNKGLDTFDFNPSGSHEGVVRFKDKFQPERRPAPVISGKSVLVKAADSLIQIRKWYG